MTLKVIQLFWVALILFLNKALHHGCLGFLEQLVIMDGIGKYFLIEKMAFCWYLTFSFMKHKFPGTIFSLSVPIDFLWLHKHFNLHEERWRGDFSKDCKSYFPTTQVINGFTYRMSEAAVTSFPSFTCSEHFRKYRWKSPYRSNDCLWKLYL